MIRLRLSRYKKSVSCKRFLIICAFLITISSCQEEDHLILRKRTGETYRTNTNMCPYGSYFYKEPRHIDCICSKGLWVFYENSCGDPSFIQGSEKHICTPINFRIKKSLLISDTTDPIFTTLHPKDGIVLKLYQNSINYPFKLAGEELILVSGEWKVQFGNGRSTCLGKPGHFCLYEPPLSMEGIDNVYKGACDQPAQNSDNLITSTPWTCAKFSLASEPDSNDCNDKQGHRHRRQVSSAPDQPQQKQQGRAFISASLGMNPEFAANYHRKKTTPVHENPRISPQDEDDEYVRREGSPLIKSQIWNYLTETANVLLRLSDPPVSKGNFKISAFTFLNIAKEIMQKTCPTFYVPASHFDLSVSIFRTIQIRDMLYDEPPISHDEVDRITKALLLCRKKVKPFNFTINQEPTCNLTGDNNALVMRDIAYPFDPYAYIGRFKAFDDDQYIDVPHQLSPWNREPIIETVWNIFFHVHSLCYPYFSPSVSNASTFNDHHKFSTVMMSLFTNGILDLWTEIKEIESDIYSGFLGDAKLLMANVAHCAITGRLQFNETYPWDLVKPGNKSETGTTTTETPAAAPTTAQTETPANSRKKRQMPASFYLQENYQAQLGCLGSIRDNSFVCKD